MNKTTLVMIRNLLIAVVLALLLGLIVLFAVSFFQVNAERFSILPIVAFAHGWEKFWVWIYLAADAGYLLVLGLLFLELSLFLVRLIGTLIVRGVAAVRGNDPAPLVAAVRKLSLATPIRALGINTPTKSIVAYVALIVVVLGSGWVAKKVLEGNDSLVYRSIVVENLESDELVVDVTDDIANGDAYDVVVTAGVGNVHLYAVSDTTEIKVYFLYDTAAQKDTLVWSVDPASNRIDVAFAHGETGYVRYADPLPGAVEIYVPKTLPIADVTVNLAAYGNLTIEYLGFESLSADVAAGRIGLTAADVSVGDVTLVSRGGEIAVKADGCDSLSLTLSDGAQATVTAGTVQGTLQADLQAGTSLLAYSTAAARLDVEGAGADVELRELYAPIVAIRLSGGSLLYSNGDKDYVHADWSLETDGTDVSLRGVPDDQNG
ncbi:MAG: hypothetical protein WC509_03460 [Candidatus Izemoplasmatales bacterium]